MRARGLQTSSILRSFLLLAGAAGSAAVAFTACSSSECSGAACAAPADAGPDVEDTGPVCEPAMDPKDHPACVDDTFGVFVDKEGGDDSNAGTRAAPVKSVSAALSKLDGKKRVFLCEGNYFEHITISSPVSIHGGFACGTWSYNGTKARFAPNDTGYILQLVLTTEPILVTDLALEAVDGRPGGAPSIASSVAAFITRSANVTLRRMSISAGAGATGEDAPDAIDYAPESAPDGYGGDDPAQPGKARQNPGCTASIGGAGGREDSPNGRAGQASRSPSFPETSTGAGGVAGSACDAGGKGVDGSYGQAGKEGTGAASFGSLDTTGWKPTSGMPGGKGGDGQGGGGGAWLAGTGIGGAGGPGGCGGAGGAGGAGGGSSIALLVFDSAVSVEASTLVAKDAGAGGKGGNGQRGQLASASAGAPSDPAEACAGGAGGVGGSGGGGGGGAGGVSAGILYKGPAPTIDGASTTSAEALPFVSLGAGSPGGASGLGGEAARASAPASSAGEKGTAGVAGVAQAVIGLP